MLVFHSEPLKFFGCVKVSRLTPVNEAWAAILVMLLMPLGLDAVSCAWVLAPTFLPATEPFKGSYAFAYVILVKARGVAFLTPGQVEAMGLVTTEQLRQQRYGHRLVHAVSEIQP